jgi:hypothetical protein
VPARTDRKAKAGGGLGGATTAGREFVDLVIAYAKQETLGPLRGLGRFVLAGMVATIFWSVGAILLLLALLRALQTETGSTFGGNLSWLPYVITAIASLAVLALAAWRIMKTPTARTPAATASAAAPPPPPPA